MKKVILVLLVAIAINTNAQTLKEALYGGKLKTDTGTVLRKGEDLSSKIDSNRKAPVVAPEKKPVAAATDSTKKMIAPGDSMAAPVAEKLEVAPATGVGADNNRVWKVFLDSTISILNQDLAVNKKYKKGEYSVTVDYVIELDGKITINNVYVSPENKSLAIQVKERLNIDTPQLKPVLSSNGKPRKINKRQSFMLVKN